MRAKFRNKFVAVFLALAVLFMSVPFGAFARAEEAAESDAEGVYVLDASKLQLVEDKDNGTFTNGQAPVAAGTDEYFKIHVDKDTRFDGSNPKFEDGFEGTQRINFNGGTNTSSFVNSVEFTTANPATVKIWWRSGDKDRYVALFNQSGAEVAKTATATEKNTVSYIDSFEVTAAGKYYIGNVAKSNYIFKIEVTEHAPKTYVLDASNLPLVNDKDNGTFSNGQEPVIAGEENFFKIHVDKDTRFDVSKQKFEDGFEGTQRINFNGGTNTSSFVNSIEFTASGAATVKVWWRSGDKDRYVALFNQSGDEVAKTAAATEKNTVSYIDTFKVTDAGKYYIGNVSKSNYIFKVEVTVGGGKIVRGDWNDVVAPKITKAEQASGNINVTVSAVVGNDGGDKVVVDMFDKSGKTVETKQSLAAKNEHTLTFTPKSSGTYTFKATLSRDGETDKVSAVSEACDFTLPLAKPTITSATSMGGGKIALVWTAVNEATGYNIYRDGTKVGTATGITYEVSGLTVGTKYSFTVSAVRDSEEGSKSAAVEATATEDKKAVWSHVIYGVSVGTSDGSNGYSGNVNEEGKVTVFSEGGKGKIVNGGADGLTFYYTPVPDNLNFTLRANMHVDKWTWSNGQEAMGMMVADSVPEMGKSLYWTNLYYLTLGTVAYNWNNGALDYNGQGDKYDMRLGLGVYPKLGITPATWNNGDPADTAKIDLKTQYTLETSAAQKGLASGQYNIAKGVTNPSAAPQSIDQISDFIIEIQRNNTGYFFTYYAQDGKTIIGRQKFYDTKALSNLDKDNVYVGFFAARNARATFSDITLSTIAPEDDVAAEERPIEKIPTVVNITSAGVANSSSYTLMVNSNISGTADITLNGTSVASGKQVTGGELFNLPLSILEGSNKITVVFTPDATQNLGEYKELESTAPVTLNLNVTYDTYYANQKNLYVAPNGKSTGNGGTDYPLDIYTAVSVVKPGQTIVIMEGTYNLTSPVRIERGIDGTAENPIRMIADPNAKSRPVFDFNKACEGVRLGGNYWYMYGFNVTNTANKAAGFRVCGSNNIIDQIVTHHNGNTGLQISAYRDSSDPRELWPHDNLILNCTSFNNADNGYEDADGFAAKLTCGEGNVFDGCVSHHNADDGWDLYARATSGSIGKVTIRNCVAYCNGFLLDGTNAGNGNGFKLGGENLPAGHVLENCITFDNKADGITSNSCPDVKVINCTSYHNGYFSGKDSFNLNLYTNASSRTTEYKVEGLVSYGGKAANRVKKNSNDNSVLDGSETTDVTIDAFVSTTFVPVDEYQNIARKADGTIDLGNFLKLSANAPAGAGADLGKAEGSTPSEDVGTITPDENLPAPKPESSGSSGFPSSSGTSDSPSSSDDSSLTFEDDDTEIKVTAPSGAFDNDVKFNAVPITAETNDRTFTFDLSFTDKDGNKVQPKVAVIVKIPVPTALVGKTIYVYHVENDGSYTEISSKVEDGMVVFTASSFSKYIITTEKLVTSNSNPNPNTGVQSHGGLVFTIAGLAAVCSFKRKRRL